MIYQAGKRAIERLYFIKYNFLITLMNINKKKHIIEVWPGPMEGVMKAPFIQTATKLNLVSRWMTPFFRVTTHIPAKKHLDEFLTPFLNTGLPISGQIMGTDAKLLAETAQIMLSLGCSEVNFNCGCPSARVVSGNAGGGALKNLQTLAGIIRYLRQNIPEGKFSIKSRIGYDRLQTDDVLHTLIAYGQPDRLTIHCRSVKELYQPVADKENRFEKIINFTKSINSKQPFLILNGDIDSVEFAKKLVQKTGNCGIMCARPWMSDPGLLKRIEGEHVADKEVLREMFFETFKTFNSAAGASLEVARMLWGVNSEQFKQQLNCKHTE